MASITAARLRHDLAGVAFGDASVTADGLRAAGDAALGRLLPTDDAFWVGVDFAAGRVDVVRGAEHDRPLGAALARVVADDPVTRSFIGRPADLSPRRQSDVVDRRSWERTATYQAAFRGRPERYRLSLVFDLRAPVQGFGWSGFRERRDFTDAEVELAATLHPLLATIAALTGPHWASVDEPLTPREVDVLRLLATGRTARAIGATRGIAEGTVRKHIEHIYDKLGAHDRLLAVAEARRRGYL